MPRIARVRWSAKERCWVSDVGAEVVDRSGRKRRQRVYFREDEAGPIPFGPAPRSEGYRRASAALERYLASSRAVAVPRGPSVADLCKAYQAHCRRRLAAGKLKPRSLASINEALELWCNWPEDSPYGYRQADEIGPREMALFMQLRVGEDGHYARRIVTTVLAAWKRAHKQGLIPTNPLADVDRPTGPPRTGRRPDRQVFRKWLRLAWAKARTPKARHRRVNRVTLLLLRAIADTGARPEELCLARWDELDPVLLTLDPATHKTAGRGKSRLILFPRRWARTLAYLRRTGHPTYLFTHGQHRARKADAVRRGDDQGEPWNPQALGTWARRWGIPCTRYDLRRLVASELADAGLDYQRIADLLGNSPAIVQSVYAKRSAESLRAELDRLPRPGGDRPAK